jgi:hypothetical protein
MMIIGSALVFLGAAAIDQFGVSSNPIISIAAGLALIGIGYAHGK